MPVNRGQWTKKRRPSRNFAKRILVVTEGQETEPQYVELLVAYLRSQATSTHVKTVGVGKDPLKVVRKCIELRDAVADDAKAFNHCVALVDVDMHQTLGDACALASKESILLLVTNLKFEMWLRWHAESTRSAMTTDQLDKRVEKLGLVSRKSLLPGFPIWQVDQAITVAQAADPGMMGGAAGPNPSSAMPLLVDLVRQG